MCKNPVILIVFTVFCLLVTLKLLGRRGSLLHRSWFKLQGRTFPVHDENKANDINFMWNNLYCVCWISSNTETTFRLSPAAFPPHPHPAPHTTEHSVVISVFNMFNHPTYLFNQTIFWACIQPSKAAFEKDSENTKVSRLWSSFWSRSLTFWNQKLT